MAGFGETIIIYGQNATTGDAIGAFVGDELRGTGEIIEFESATYINMTVSLAGGEEMVEFVTTKNAGAGFVGNRR